MAKKNLTIDAPVNTDIPVATETNFERVDYNSLFENSPTAWLNPDHVLIPETNVSRIGHDWDSDEEQKMLQLLGESIAREGQLQPILVILESDGVPRLVSGERRLRAIKWYNSVHESKLDVEAKLYQNTGNVDLDVVTIQENAQRQNMTPIEMANAIQYLLDRGYTRADIAALIPDEHGMPRSQAWITQRLKLRTLTEAEQQLVHSGVVNATVAEELTKLKDETIRQKLFTKAAETGMTKDMAKNAVAAITEESPEAAAPRDARGRRSHAEQAESGGRVPRNLRQVRAAIDELINTEFPSIAPGLCGAMQALTKYMDGYYADSVALAKVMLKSMDAHPYHQYEAEVEVEEPKKAKKAKKAA